jgi:ELWxxDGT repeat protein
MRKKLPFQSFNALAALKRIAFVSALCISMMTISVCLHAQAQLIKDLNRLEQMYFNEYSSLTDGNGTLYFISRGKELWRSDGTNAGTIKLKTLDSLAGLTWVGSTLYFSGDDGNGLELWKSNGLGSGTTKVKEIRAGAVGSNPANFTNVNGALYFTANDGNTGRELWKSDGTAAGTMRVKDIYGGVGSSNPSYLANVNGTLYFAANNNVNGRELWKSNGTSAGTIMVADSYAGSTGSAPEHLTNFNGVLYYAALQSTTGRELWKSNGTSAGTVRVKDINQGIGSSHINGIVVMGSAIYFSADDGNVGPALWKSNGTSTGTVLVKDIAPNYGGNGPLLYLKAVDGNLYFLGHNGNELYMWKSNGTAEGTRQIMLSENLNPQVTSLNGTIYFMNSYFESEEYVQIYELYKMTSAGTVTPIWSMKDFTLCCIDGVTSHTPELVRINNTLYFWGIKTEGAGYKLLKSAGTSESTVIVKDTYTPTISADPNPFVKVNDIVYLLARGEYDTYQTIWRTNGTTAGTIMLKKMSEITDIEVVGDKVFFAGYNYNDQTITDEWQLWKTDGTVAGTVRLKQLDSYTGTLGARGSWNNILFFSVGRTEIWRSDGTAAGTIKLKGWTGYNQGIEQLASSASGAFFTVSTGSGGAELWKSNGTAAGTVKVKTLRTGAGSMVFDSYPHITVNNIFYFTVADGVDSYTLWRTDGTAAGTYMLMDLHPYKLGEFQGTLYVNGRDDNSNFPLYRSNGTPEGTAKLLDRGPIQHFMPYGDQLLFIESEGSGTGNFLWTTDGTPEGTVMVKSFYNGFSFGDMTHTVVNNIIYFTSGWGQELWRTDGTGCGTFSINTGLIEVSPVESIGTNLVIGGYTFDYGKELYRYNTANAPASPCGDPIAARSATQPSAALTSSEELTVSLAPNPFNSHFSLNINGKENSEAEVVVFTSTGAQLEVRDLPCNTTHEIGQTWPAGLYIMKVSVEGKMFTRKMIKN